MLNVSFLLFAIRGGRTWPFLYYMAVARWEWEVARLIAGAPRRGWGRWCRECYMDGRCSVQMLHA